MANPPVLKIKLPGRKRKHTVSICHFPDNVRVVFVFEIVLQEHNDDRSADEADGVNLKTPATKKRMTSTAFMARMRELCDDDDEVTLFCPFMYRC